MAEARNYWVCTVRPDGRPHAKPVWGPWLDDSFVFSTHPETVTARDLRTNAEVAVHLESEEPSIAGPSGLPFEDHDLVPETMTRWTFPDPSPRR